MKKTAKELVYDAINWMRKPTADVTLSPIQDSDDLKDTYGFTNQDICKLVDAIGLDCEKELPHAPIHAVKTVKEVIEAVDELIQEDSLYDGLRSSIYMATFLNHLDKEKEDVASIIARLTMKRSVYTLLGLDMKHLEETDAAFIAYMKTASKISKYLSNSSIIDKMMKLNKQTMQKQDAVSMLHYKKLIDEA